MANKEHKAKMRQRLVYRLRSAFTDWQKASNIVVECRHRLELYNGEDLRRAAELALALR